VIPGKPATAHWDIDNPAAVNGTSFEVREAFAQIYQTQEEGIEFLINKLNGTQQ
jgi:hypothetical protein